MIPTYFAFAFSPCRRAPLLRFALHIERLNVRSVTPCGGLYMVLWFRCKALPPIPVAIYPYSPASRFQTTLFRITIR